MHLSRLLVSNFRNIRQAELLPAEGLNFIYGDNGSGKTSLLEAIYSLSRGYSFRTRKYTELIHRDSEDFLLFAELDLANGCSKIGISRPRRAALSQFRLNGRAVHTALELVALIPTQIIDAHSFLLLEGGPRARRMFLDWLVFHVKQDFGEIWRHYARAVKQRNSLLRRDRLTSSDLKPWDVELVRYGQLMDAYRQETLSEFLPRLHRLLRESGLVDDLPVTVEYASGWRTDTDLQEQLSQCLERDRKLGYTSVGPHKSDLILRCHGKEAASFLSRGQQKTLVSALHVAQVNSLIELTGRRCLILIDDLPAELDRYNRQHLCQWLAATQCQAFVSGVELLPIASSWPGSHLDKAKVFHVKQGQIVEQPYSLGAEND